MKSSHFMTSVLHYHFLSSEGRVKKTQQVSRGLRVAVCLVYSNLLAWKWKQELKLKLKYVVAMDESIGILWISADKVRSSGTRERGLAQTLSPWVWVNLSSCCAFKKPGRILPKLQSGDIIKTMGLMGLMTKSENKAPHFRASHDIIPVWQRARAAPPSLGGRGRTFLGSRRALAARLMSFLVIATRRGPAPCFHGRGCIALLAVAHAHWRGNPVSTSGGCSDPPLRLPRLTAGFHPVRFCGSRSDEVPFAFIE